MLDFNEEMRSVLVRTIDVTALEKAARAGGMSTLRESAIRKMLMGHTTYEEVISVT